MTPLLGHNAAATASFMVEVLWKNSLEPLKKVPMQPSPAWNVHMDHAFLKNTFFMESDITVSYIITIFTVHSGICY